MGFNSLQMREGMKILKRRMQTKEHHRYQGTVRDILHKIVRNNWNGTFFCASNGHFHVFYMRDFGLALEGLLHMGYRREVAATLENTLKIYAKHNRLTTTITDQHIPVDMFEPACDTLPFLLRSLRKTRSTYLLKTYFEFLNDQINKYYKDVFDPKKEVVYEKKSFSSMRDHYKRKSSMYDNACMAMLADEIVKLKDLHIRFDNPFMKWNHRKVLRDRFWVGSHFLDDISAHHYLATDANTIPYYFDLFNDKDMMESSMNFIISQGLDGPIPAKYTKDPIKEKENPILNFLAPNYEGNTCWTNVGMLFLQLVEKVNRILLKKYIDRYIELIEEHQNFLEVFTPEGKPYKTRFYMYDEGMLWCSVFYLMLDRYYSAVPSFKFK
ncbi:MAG: hypothetical protein ACOC32_04825 [Nanoarchaeota archaeon]